jgi:polysaccharide pyruvyl transferase WcaK-like protein
MPKVLVYGWYHQGNLGDDLFIEAFRYLFPNFDFVFTNSINSDKLEGVDAVFFGGGSFLLGRPLITDAALKILKSKKIFYLGVGVEADIHPIHMGLMVSAQMIATRSQDQLQKLECLNKNSLYVPDLVYSLRPEIQLSQKTSRSVLILPNISVVPRRFDPHWKHAAWTYFKSEFTQFLDWLVDNGYHPSFFAMCQGAEINDDWAAAELIGHMEKRHQRYLLTTRPTGIVEISKLISSFDAVITQRFHGIVLSEMTQTPYMGIHHHDKLKLCTPNNGLSISYYNNSKQPLIDAMHSVMKMSIPSNDSEESTIFKAFTTEVINLL